MERSINPGAVWHNPQTIGDWSGALSGNEEIVLYCVRGGSVSNSVVDTLRSLGLDAGFIENGVAGWKAAGGEVAGK